MLSYNTHKGKLDQIKKAQLSLSDNVEFFLSEISAHQDINAFNFVFADSVAQAKSVEEKIKSNSAGKLAGMVIAVKDLLAIKDKPLTCSSNILGDFKSVYTATTVQKLIDEDAVIIGTTNCDEFAMGSTNESSAFGKVLNPLDKSRVPGGSSGGSAAAVAANLCDAAIGTDTGGSVRQPAAFTGTYGIKPTYGRVSRFGLTSYASSFDCVGAIAKNIYDISLITEVISGKDENDSTSVKSDLINFSPSGKKYKIGVPKEYFVEGLDSQIKDSLRETIGKLEDEGHEIVEVSLPNSEYAVAAYYILATAEASANLSRFDGVRYGKRDDKIKSFGELYELTKTAGFGKEVKRRIMLGTYVLSSGYYDAYYTKAQKVRRLIKENFENVFRNVDLIFSPTTPTPPYKLGETANDPLKMYLGDVYTVPANLTGVPAISIPVNISPNGLPIAAQFMAPYFRESDLFEISSQLEQIK